MEFLELSLMFFMQTELCQISLSCVDLGFYWIKLTIMYKDVDTHLLQGFDQPLN